MKTWQWILVISIAVAFVALLINPLLMPMNWGTTPMMGRGYSHWGGVYSPWEMSWLFVTMRFLFWLLSIAVIALLTILFLDRQRHREVPELVDEN